MRLILAPLMAFLASPLSAGDLQQVALQRLQTDPAPFMALAARVISSQGEEGFVGQMGVERFVAMERATALAAAMRLQMADDNLDGIVTQAEMTARAAALAQAANDRLWGQFHAADGNGDGLLSNDEIAAFRLSQAEGALSPVEEAMAFLVLSFDADNDGRVSLEEVEAGVSALGT